MSASPERLATVDLAAITRNTRALRRAAGTPHLMAVVKADGYGHGALPTALAALDGGADWLGVADVDEGLALRAAGVAAPVLAWLHGASPDFGPAALARIDVGVSSLDQLERAAAAGATVQVKVETGLGRNGVAPEERQAVLRRAAELERAGRIRVRGLFSHLANTSDASDREAEAAFAAALAEARAAGLDPELVHLASSAAAIARDRGACTMVRCGIAIYGLSPFADDRAAGMGLTPAMTLTSRVAAVRRLPAGAGVSYDHTWHAPRDTTVALVPIGYADGVPRAASNRAEVQLNGVRRPVRGRIAMDQFVVEVGNDDVAVGDPVTLFGDPATGVPGADDWAGWADTINYEIVTRLGPRVVKRYSGR